MQSLSFVDLTLLIVVFIVPLSSKFIFRTYFLYYVKRHPNRASLGLIYPLLFKEKDLQSVEVICFKYLCYV